LLGRAGEGVFVPVQKSMQQRVLSMPIRLTERAVIEVSGPDARAYLHSLVTNDIMNLQPGQTCWAGLLTPQCKILFDFFVHDASGKDEQARFLLDVPATRRDDLVSRMSMYRLRRKVEITPREDLAVAVDLAADAAPRDAIVYADPRFAEMGTRAFVPVETASTLSTDALAWHERRIRLGLPDSEMDIGSQKLFSHEANFDCLNGVSFTKCGALFSKYCRSRKHSHTNENWPLSR